MLDPPFEAGALHVTVKPASVGVTEVTVGAPGTVSGEAFSYVDGEDVPATLVAVTVTLYSVPLVSPYTVQFKGPDVQPHVVVVVPSVTLTVYCEIVAPPSSVGAFHETWSWLFPAVMVSMSGAPGTVRGVALTDELDAESPAALWALTDTEYCVPLSRPVIVHCSDPVVHSQVELVVPSVAVAV